LSAILYYSFFICDFYLPETVLQSSSESKSSGSTGTEGKATPPVSSLLKFAKNDVKSNIDKKPVPKKETGAFNVGNLEENGTFWGDYNNKVAESLSIILFTTKMCYKYN